MSRRPDDSLATQLMQQWQKFWLNKKKSGFTLIELLVIITIVGVFAMLGVIALQSSQTRSRDAQRKTDLEKIKVALEEYYNDNSCYPPLGTFDDCNGSGMVPYLKNIPCDPRTGDPYVYEPLSESTCSGYRLFGLLEDVNDPSIGKVGCADGACGSYNYGISSGATLNSGGGVTFDEEALGEYGGNWACDPNGICNSYQNPQQHDCPASFANNDCDNLCGNQAYRCGS